jgi:hypothetical protein
MNLRPLEWIFAWRQERPVIEASARLCTVMHPFYSVGGGDIPAGPVHIDVTLRVFKRRGGKVSLFDIEATVGGQALEPVTWFRPIEVEAGASPVEEVVSLGLPGGRSVEASSGDVVELSLRATHRTWPIRARARIG